MTLVQAVGGPVQTARRKGARMRLRYLTNASFVVLASVAAGRRVVVCPVQPSTIRPHWGGRGRTPRCRGRAV